MALPAIKSAGKAVADVKALYLLKKSSSVNSISSLLSASGWFNVLTLRGTVNAGQDAPSLSAIHVDQFDAPIGITSEPGDFTFEAQLPSLAKADIESFLGSGNIVSSNDSTINKSVFGFDLDGTLYEMSVMIQTRTNQYIIFPAAQVSLTFSKEDKVFLLRLSGQVITPEEEGLKMVYLALDDYSAGE